MAWLAGGFPHLHGDVEVTRFQAGRTGRCSRPAGISPYNPSVPSTLPMIWVVIYWPGPIVDSQNYGIFRLWRSAHRGRGKHHGRGDGADSQSFEFCYAFLPPRPLLGYRHKRHTAMAVEGKLQGYQPFLAPTHSYRNPG